MTYVFCGEIRGSHHRLDVARLRIADQLGHPLSEVTQWLCHRNSERGRREVAWNLKSSATATAILSLELPEVMCKVMRKDSAKVDLGSVSETAMQTPIIRVITAKSNIGGPWLLVKRAPYIGFNYCIRLKVCIFVSFVCKLLLKFEP